MINLTYWAFCVCPDDVDELVLHAAVVRQKADTCHLPDIRQTFFDFLQP